MLLTGLWMSKIHSLHTHPRWNLSPNFRLTYKSLTIHQDQTDVLLLLADLQREVSVPALLWDFNAILLQVLTKTEQADAETYLLLRLIHSPCAGGGSLFPLGAQLVSEFQKFTLLEVRFLMCSQVIYKLHTVHGEEGPQLWGSCQPLAELDS